MSFHSWLRNLRSVLTSGRGHHPKPGRSAAHQLRLESLEDRTVPSGYQQINLVSIQSAMARSTDPNLNGWGMTEMPNGSYCVANAFTTGLATFYTASGHVLPQTISVPGSAAGSAALGLPAIGHPTGVVYNSSSDFVISENGKSAPALLIFDSIDGTISGWNPAVDATHAIPIHDTFAEGDPAVFTGLELAQNKGQNVLYATDFLNDKVDMFDSHFNLIGSFTDASVKTVDPNLSAWSVQAVGDRLYVTFADLKNFSGGAVDVFNTDGKLRSHVAANAPGAGPLDNPWGIIQAPANFGTYSNDILIGNVAGDGNINAYDPKTGAYLGQLDQPDGSPIAIKGLWDLEFGDGTPDGGRTNQLFFDAGPNKPGDSTGGLFGVIQTAENSDKAAAAVQPVQQTLSQPLQPSTLTVTNTQDHGRGSLRAEIAAAVSGDTIVFSPTLDGKTIRLTSGELDITKNLTIQGPGAGELTIIGKSSTIYGTPYSRIFEVIPGTTVTLTGLTISNGVGRASASSFGGWDGYGGGILNLGTLTVSDCTVSNCYALNEGGGIFNDGTLTVSGCTVSGNRTSHGGGIWNEGTATLVSSTISNNWAQDTSPGTYQPDGTGGGIYNRGTLTLSGCTVSDNYINGVAGAGITNDTSGKLTVKNSSTITDDVWNFGVFYLDSTSTTGVLDGNPAIPI